MEQGDPTTEPDNDLLKDELFPDDMYDGQTYWADLPFGPRNRWVNKQSDAEAKREILLLGREFKKDPLQPIRDYFGTYVITGMGMFVEGYTLFSVGNLTALFQSVWPTCWKTYAVCTENWIAAVGYMEIIGIILGQVTVGLIGDWIGRRWGLIQDVVIMFIGTILLTAMWGESLQGWVIMYAFSLMFYSFGVGGEYPMTSTRAMEAHTGHDAAIKDRMHRGRNVVLAFTMQGWGQFFNQAILILSLLIFHGGGDPPYSELSAQWTFRVSFAFVGIVTLYLVYHRIYKLKFANAQLKLSKKRNNVTGYDVKSLNLVMGHYWHRLVGTAGNWFCNDFFFYGAKIFSSTFVKVLDPTATVIVGWNWNLLNVGISLIGYYLAALLIDHRFYGRLRMQAIGFLVIFVIFVICTFKFDELTKAGAPVKTFTFLYMFASFWQQFGPNATTFLLAAEVYPAPVRATAHGFSAACGKLGALAPAVLYAYVSNQTKFYVVTWFGLAGFILTIAFVADTTGLDLREQERYWVLVRQGREHEYHGIAVHPRHLSMWEHYVLKRSQYYDPELDRQQKVEELRKRYEDSIGSADEDEDGEIKAAQGELPESVHKYFHMERELGLSPTQSKVNLASDEKALEVS
jgi:MFS family permease